MSKKCLNYIVPIFGGACLAASVIIPIVKSCNDPKDPEDAKIKLAFDPNEGQIIQGSPTQEIDQPTAFKNINVPTVYRLEYSFIGWSIDKTNVIDPEAIISEPTTFYALWEQDHPIPVFNEVIFHYGDNVSHDYVLTGSTFGSMAHPDATIAGKYFEGWYKDSSCTQRMTNQDKIFADTNVYANYIDPGVVDSYAIIDFIIDGSQGGQLLGTQQVVIKKGSQFKDVATPYAYKSGYVFANWMYSIDNTVVEDTDYINDNQSIYPAFEVSPYPTHNINIIQPTDQTWSLSVNGQTSPQVVVHEQEYINVLVSPVANQTPKYLKINDGFSEVMLELVEYSGYYFYRLPYIWETDITVSVVFDSPVPTQDFIIDIVQPVDWQLSVNSQTTQTTAKIGDQINVEVTTSTTPDTVPSTLVVTIDSHDYTLPLTPVSSSKYTASFAYPFAANSQFSVKLVTPITPSEIKDYCYTTTIGSDVWMYLYSTIETYAGDIARVNLTTWDYQTVSRSSFNETIEIGSKVTAIGNDFLYGCSSFNNGGQPLVVPESVTSIGENFMFNDIVFNQNVTLAATEMSQIGPCFMSNCYAMVNTVSLAFDPNVMLEDPYEPSFASDQASASATTGIKISVVSAAAKTAFETLFPNISDAALNVYRKTSVTTK